jgi:3-oxoacyl-[acyl-carrier-protein] synthase II
MTTLKALLLAFSLVLVFLQFDGIDGFRMPRASLSFQLKSESRSSLQMMSDKERIVVTGMGIISPSGQSLPSFFDHICEGVSAIEKVDRFDPSPYKCKIAAQIRGFEPASYYQTKKKIKQNDLSCHYAVAATRQAMDDAKLNLNDGKIDATRVGVVVGSAFGGMDSFEKAAISVYKEGLTSLDPFTIPMILGNTAPGIVAMETGAKGPNFAIQTACATATHALGEVIIQNKQ